MRQPSPIPPARRRAATPCWSPEAARALRAEITRQLKPFWRAPTGVDADKLITVLTWRLNQDGSLASGPTLVKQDGKTVSNFPAAAASCRGGHPRRTRARRLSACRRICMRRQLEIQLKELSFDKRLGPMTHMLPRVALLALLLAVGSGTALAQAQPQTPPAPKPEQGLTGSVTDDKGDIIRIAIPAHADPAGHRDARRHDRTARREGCQRSLPTTCKGSGLFAPIGPGGLAKPTMAEVTAPAYPRWAGIGAESLVQGFVRSAGGDAQITVGCYLYDVALKQELTPPGLCRRTARLAPRRASLRRPRSIRA